LLTGYIVVESVLWLDDIVCWTTAQIHCDCQQHAAIFVLRTFRSHLRIHQPNDPGKRKTKVKIGLRNEKSVDRAHNRTIALWINI